VDPHIIVLFVTALVAASPFSVLGVLALVHVLLASVVDNVGIPLGADRLGLDLEIRQIVAHVVQVLFHVVIVPGRQTFVDKYAVVVGVIQGRFLKKLFCNFVINAVKTVALRGLDCSQHGLKITLALGPLTAFALGLRCTVVAGTDEAIFRLATAMEISIAKNERAGNEALNGFAEAVAAALPGKLHHLGAMEIIGINPVKNLTGFGKEDKAVILAHVWKGRKGMLER
jgi:hypothetical protein